MEQTLIYTNKTKPMSRCLGENQEILIKDSSNAEKGSSFYSQEQNPSYDFIGRGSVPTLIIGNDEEYDIEDEESEFKMGRLIRQASLNSSHMSTPQQSIKVMTGSSSLHRYLSQKIETNQGKITDMRKVESMKERNRSKHPMKIGKNNGGAPTIPRGWVDKGSSEDMKAQIKFWARAVAFNLHQEC
ncbi:hypothetical protein HanRHA438_Chr13g0579941 [Helianthus annuus]|nr:hypothetical protein HanIR_Chr13g0619281 [Helianthus annuus]KAJ0847641.1 hypothetical protein HanPSC8_Chr13g0547551 [Helianthus annuus]KAJ0856573.1 hypothetical protein HanRHA438_Chr13g0579941 [Helianthus annuus]